MTRSGNPLRVPSVPTPKVDDECALWEQPEKAIDILEFAFLIWCSLIDLLPGLLPEHPLPVEHP